MKNKIEYSWKYDESDTVAVENLGAHYYRMRCGQSWRPSDTRRLTLMSRGECMGMRTYDHNADL